MPLIPNSDYHPPFPAGSGHFQTVFPSLFRKVPDVQYVRERIATPDGDFIDIDWSRSGGKKAVILSHGLEGHSGRAYMRGMVRVFNRRGWDAVAFNFRSCSGQINRLPRFYHSGATDDLHTVVCHVLDRGHYQTLALAGFSLGGNLTLKYLGECGEDISPFIRCGAAISVPCDLASSSRRLFAPVNRLYLKRFFRYFEKKIRDKATLMPDRIDATALDRIRTMEEYDNCYTAPLHGFTDAADYYARCSCRGFLDNIAVPALVISARNDPLLPPECFPFEAAKNSRFLFLETPDSGGHVGFIARNHNGEYWHERRVAAFVMAHGEADENSQKCTTAAR